MVEFAAMHVAGSQELWSVGRYFVNLEHGAGTQTRRSAIRNIGRLSSFTQRRRSLREQLWGKRIKGWRGVWGNVDLSRGRV